MSKIKRKCPICKKSYEIYESAYKAGKGKTCSLKCSYIHRGLEKTKNLIGKKEGMLTIIKKTDNIGNKVAWIAKCDCGNFTSITSGDFLRKDKRRKHSCGCLLKRKGKDSPLWKGYKKLSGKYFSALQNGAKERNLQFQITPEYIYSLLENQNFKCNLTGDSIKLNNNQTASLDRIDSSKGYVKGNVQWVHKDINKLKGAFDEEDFINLCKKVTNYKC